MKLHNPFFIVVFSVLIASCISSKTIEKEVEHRFSEFKQNPNESVSVDSLLQRIAHLEVRQREDSLIKYMSKGWMPAYNFRFKKVSFEHKNTSGKKNKISFWASPANENYVRMPLTPQAAQLLADQFHCVLPTTKMVDEIYKKASIKLPLFR